MKFYIQNILFYLFILIMFITGCSKNGTAPKTSEHLFELGLSPTELANRKRDFLTRSSLRNPAIFPNRLVNLDDSKLNNGHTCPSPRMAAYDEPDGGTEAYCIQIPKEFRNNIPKEIKREIISHDLDTLEVFFITQHRNLTDIPISSSVSVFRVHNWVYPHIPAALFVGTIFNRDILMTVYSNSMVRLSNQIVEKRLLPFNVNIHDNRISPDNAHTAIASAPAQNFSFYSLVIDPPTKRAVVTLHWIIERNDFLDDGGAHNANYLNSLQYLNNSFVGALPISVQTLIGRIQALASGRFTPAASEPMRSLNSLLL